MMRASHSTIRTPHENGQAVVIILIFLSLFLLGFLGFGSDLSQLWALRQGAQGAADAACQAGAADLFMKSQNTAGLDTSWVGGSVSCGAGSTNPVCSYAYKNGGYYGSNVQVSFPASVDGAPSLTGFGAVAYPYIQVTISDTLKLTFLRAFSKSTTWPVTATAICGLSPVQVPIPLVVLNKTLSGALSINGTPTISIYGGPRRAVQVDSSSATAFQASGSKAIVDLSLAGPSNSGAEFGVFGTETKPANVSLGSSGKWVSPSFPYGDPWILISLPSAPSTAGQATNVGYGVNGCPDPAGCTEFSGGNYSTCTNSGNLVTGGTGCLSIPVGYTITFGTRTAANNNTNFSQGAAIRPSTGNAGNFVFQATNSAKSGLVLPTWPQVRDQTVTDGSVVWKNVGNPTTKPNTAIFDPGLYYLGSGGLQLGAGSTVRPSTATGDGSNGTTFYFTSGGSNISVGSNSGKSSDCSSVTNPTSSAPVGSPSNCVTTYKVSGTASGAATGNVLSQALQCPTGGASNPSQVPATVQGNILLGPCSGTYAAASTDGHQYRGFLFFQNRAASSPGTPNWGGGGQFLLAGFMYFHDPSYGSTLNLSGNSGAGAYTLGNIIADQVTLGGTSGLKMILNPASSYQIIRPSLLK